MAIVDVLDLNKKKVGSVELHDGVFGCQGGPSIGAYGGCDAAGV